MEEKTETAARVGIGRRELLLGGAGAALVSLATAAFAASDEHAGHHEHGGGGANNQPVVDAALGCVNAGVACIDHCLVLLAGGDTSIAECAKAVQAMLPTCDTLAKLAAYQSKHLPAYAKVCAEICATCEAECRKHEAHHAQCKACADSCAKCIAACNMIAA